MQTFPEKASYQATGCFFLGSEFFLVTLIFIIAISSSKLVFLIEFLVSFVEERPWWQQSKLTASSAAHPYVLKANSDGTSAGHTLITANLKLKRFSYT